VGNLRFDLSGLAVVGDKVGLSFTGVTDTVEKRF
jgi:hypothetical protein